MPIRKRPCCHEYDSDHPEEHLERVQAPDGRMKLICKHCKKHHKFAKSDATIERLKERQAMIDEMTGDGEFLQSLSFKDKGFLPDIYDQTHINPKQFQYLHGLYNKLLAFRANPHALSFGVKEKINVIVTKKE
jgi:hypothetical protein